MRKLLKRLKKAGKGEKGFTLIELMAVLVILGLIVGLVVPNFAIITKKADSTFIAGQHEKMREAVYKYYHDVSAWPTEWGGVNLSEEKNHQLWTNKDDAGNALSAWAGPYIDRPILQDNRWNGDWGVLEKVKFFDTNLSGTYVCLVYDNVPKLVCEQVDALLDDGDNDAGVVEYTSNNSGDTDHAAIDLDDTSGNGSEVDWTDGNSSSSLDEGTNNILVIAIFKQ